MSNQTDVIEKKTHLSFQTVRELSEAQKEIVRAQVERLAANSLFSSSKRSCEILRYCVEETISGRDDALKERTLGVALFGRPADYDTGDDSAVRVKVSDLRRRLAQYYALPERQNEVRILLPAGSYRPQFEFPVTAPAPQAEASPVRDGERRQWGLPAAGVLILMALAGLYWTQRPVDRMESFWGPILKIKQPVAFCINPAVVFKLHVPAMQRLFPQLVLDDPQTYSFQVPEDASLRGSDISAVHDQFVYSGAMHAVNRLTGLFAARGVSTSVVNANDMTVETFRNRPVVLVGSYSNRFTLAITKDLRFHFSRDGGALRIEDRMQKGRHWVLQRNSGTSKVEEDYALILRIGRHPEMGGPVFGVCGITHYGTQAAAELLTNEQSLLALERELPPGWTGKNAEIVIRAKVVAGAPVEPQVLAVHVW